MIIFLDYIFLKATQKSLQKIEFQQKTILASLLLSEVLIHTPQKMLSN